MSAIEDAIRSAVEKGYKDYSETSGSYTKKYHSDILLDPLFWQTLQKAKWEQYVAKEKPNHEWRTPDSFYRKDWSKGKRYREVHTQHDPWLKMMHRFIDHLAEGKSAEEFFATLV